MSASASAADGSAAVEALLATVSVVPDEQHGHGGDRFTGIGSRNDGVDATFGGHMLAQSVSAALATVDDDRRLHSLHGYFIRAGAPETPFTLEVDRVRDGRTFCTRRVRVHQGDDRVQFELTASFAVPEDGPTFQAEHVDGPVRPGSSADRLGSAHHEYGAGMAELPRPESLPTHHELMAGLDELPLPEAWALRDYGLDLRTINAPWAPTGPSPDGGIRLWMRARAALPDDHRIHAAIMAYQSDESLADNIAIPWGGTWGAPGVVFVSLDHAMWFHRPFDLNDWLLLDQRPITVANGRGLARASVYNRAGELVVSSAQEALLRLTPDLLAGGQ